MIIFNIVDIILNLPSENKRKNSQKSGHITKQKDNLIGNPLNSNESNPKSDNTLEPKLVEQS